MSSTKYRESRSDFGNWFGRSRLNSHKRGFFLTLIALLLVSLFILYFQIEAAQDAEPTSAASTALSTSVTSFVSSLQEYYLPSIVSVSLGSALQGMTQYLSNGYTYVNSTNQTAILFQLMTNGTMSPYSGTRYSNETLDMLIPVLVDIVQDDLNIPLTLNYTSYQVLFTQESPWTVTAKITFSYTINHTDLVISNRTLQVYGTVPITGMREPMSLINNRSYAPNITQTNISTWTIARLKSHIAAQQFAVNTAAPSYLSRLANETTASTYGIEYFIDPSRSGVNVNPALNYSFADYQFWSRPWNCTPYVKNLFNITGISNDPQYLNFMVDDAHASKYMNVTERLANVTLACS